MKKRARLHRSRQEGFTLVELLVVIATIALLAAMLLPALSRAKASAKSASCKSNLRQLGTALNMYVTDYDKYPGNAAMYGRGFTGMFFQGFWATGMNWLNPYLDGKYDANDVNSRYFAANEQRTVFSCPAVKHSGEPWDMPTVYYLDYGYNELGTGWRDGNLRLGLGFTVEVAGFADESGGRQPLGVRRYVRQGDVKTPANLIAIGDGANWLVSNNPDGILDFPYGTVTAPHSSGANLALCDGHVEYAKRGKWVARSDSAACRWNNDNQSHLETW